MQYHNTSNERFKEIVKRLINTSKYLPKLADMNEVNNQIKNEIADRQKYQTEEENEKVDCPYCLGDGGVFYTMKADNGNDYDYVARCICVNGQRNDRYRGCPNIAQIGLLRGGYFGSTPARKLKPFYFDAMRYRAKGYTKEQIIADCKARTKKNLEKIMAKAKI